MSQNIASEKKFINSERVSHEKPAAHHSESLKPLPNQDVSGGFSTHKNERSISRTIGQFIPSQQTSSMNNVSQNQHLQLSGT